MDYYVSPPTLSVGGGGFILIAEVLVKIGTLCRNNASPPEASPRLFEHRIRVATASSKPITELVVVDIMIILFTLLIQQRRELLSLPWASFIRSLSWSPGQDEAPARPADNLSDSDHVHYPQMLIISLTLIIFGGVTS